MRKLNLKDLFNAVRIVDKIGLKTVREQVVAIQKKAKADKKKGKKVDVDAIGVEFMQYLMFCLEQAEDEVYAFIQNFLPPEQDAKELDVETLMTMYKEFMLFNNKGEIANFFKKVSDSITA